MKLKDLPKFAIEIGNTYDGLDVIATREGIYVGKNVYLYDESSDCDSVDDLLDIVNSCLENCPALKNDEREDLGLLLYDEAAMTFESFWGYNVEGEYVEYLETANADLEHLGFNIVLTKNHEYGTWCCDIYKGLTKVKRIGIGEDCTDAEDVINDAWGYVLETIQQIYVVAYVGLNDDETEANGFCTTKAFTEHDKALDYAQKLKDEEIRFLTDEGREYEVSMNTEREIRISCGQGSQVRIFVEETTLE